MTDSRAVHTCVSRRTLVGGGIAGVGAVCLAACAPSIEQDPKGPDGEPGPDGQDDPDDADSGESSGDGGNALAALDDIDVGGAIAVEIDGEPVLLTRPSENEVLAFSAICTHDGCVVPPGEGDLVCPCHDSVFDPADGAVLSGPAQGPLPAIDVEVVDGQVIAA